MFALTLICLTGASAAAEMITYRFEGINTAGYFGPKGSPVTGFFSYSTDLPIRIQLAEETAYRKPWPTTQPDVYFQIHYENSSIYSTNSSGLSVMNDYGQHEPAIATFDGILISGNRLHTSEPGLPPGALAQIFLRDNSHAIFNNTDIPSSLPMVEAFDYLTIKYMYTLDFDSAIAANITSLTRINSGDLDGDGFVGITDLNIVLSNWNQTVTFGDRLSGDPSGDGFVGIEDLNLVLGNWNAGTPPTDSSTAPEPAGLFLLTMAALAARRI